MEESNPPSPAYISSSLPTTPGSSSSGSSGSMGYFSLPFERFRRDDSGSFTSAFTLLDTVETYFDARIDLLERRLRQHGDKLKTRAEEALRRTRTPIGDFSLDKYTVDLEREAQRFRLRVSSRMSSLAATWQSTKVVRTREKISFFISVMGLALSALMFGLAPQWVHIVYTVAAVLLLPLRWYRYKQKLWHYFLFDLCYYANILCLVYLWFLPNNAVLFVACYCIAHGSLASAVITWRNSLVFHDTDKVTSLFIHLYPPFTFSTIRHFYPNAQARFPALKELPHLDPGKALLLSGLLYALWQALYWKFVLVDRRKKIESGQRTTSFSFLLNDKRGVIGRMLASTKPQWREWAFMTGQLVYALVTELPAIYLLYDSSTWTGAFLLFIFAVSVWNGGGFYIEVFGRKFERELEALRKELAETIASRSESGLVSPVTSSEDGDHSPTATSAPPLPVPPLLVMDPLDKKVN